MTALLDAVATALLPLMNNPNTWNKPLPTCNTTSHEWSITHNTTIEGIPYKTAIICTHCPLRLGLSA